MPQRPPQNVGFHNVQAWLEQMWLQYLDLGEMIYEFIVVLSNLGLVALCFNKQKAVLTSPSNQTVA
jgi:hypothetical protein